MTATTEFGYQRIVEIFDTDETAGSFLREDGEGGFSSGVYRMARGIERLRAALEGSPCPYPVIEDKTVAACIKAGKCGCDNREALGSVIAPGGGPDD